MRRSRPPISVLLLTVFGFCCLYAPQPLLPVLAEEFGRSPAQVSLLITVTMLPLAFAPLVYGYVLEAVPARRMLVTAALVLTICQASLAIADAWWILILLRIGEGLALPALLLMALSVSRMPASQPTRFARSTPDIFRQVLRIPGIGMSYLAILCVFFVFAAALNVLPFRMASLNPETTATGIGFAYLGYLSGLLVSLNADRLRNAFDSEQRMYAAGFVLYGLGLLLFSLQSTAGIYVAMFAFCGGMFLVHTRLSGQVNRLGSRYKGVVNGIYIAAYYFGGALGSWLPTELYRRSGWMPFLSALAVMVAIAAVSLGAALRQAHRH